MIFDVDISDILRQVSMTERELEAAWYLAAYRVNPVIESVVYDVFGNAVSSQDSGAWPDEYTDHLFAALSRLPYEVIPTGRSVEISINFDALGTFDDLKRGYHYHAQMAGGGKVELPYTGEALARPVSYRYETWYSKVFEGELWEETIDARLAAWGSKAPEWLYLQYGNGAWNPIIEPYPIFEELQTELNLQVGERIIQELEYAVEKVEEAHITYEPRGRGSKLRGPGGRFIKSD